MRNLLLSISLCFCLALPLGAVEFLPLGQVKPGMKGVGRTVFAGEKIEEFQVEILGVLENIGPRQSIILAKLSGGPLAKTGVLAGMSGSPVYVGGKLVGALALGFPFATEAIAGIRPIAEMVETFEQRAEPPPAARRAKIETVDTASGAGLERWIPPHETELLPLGPEWTAAQPQMIPIATPVHFGGFTARALEAFGPALRRLGLEPMQGAGGSGSSLSSRLGDPKTLQPGSMISVGLIRGDLNVNADGAVTYIDGNKLYAFGHRFLASGPTEMPFMKASVIALLPNLASSFKISSAEELMGTIRQDRNTGIFGQLGARPHMIPVDLNVYSSRSGNHRYRMEVVNDQFLSPFLLQMAVFTSIDATERELGASTFRVRGRIDLGQGRPAVKLDNIYAGETSIAMSVALVTAAPMAYVMQSGFRDLRVEGVSLDILSLDEKKQLRLERVWASKPEAKPGEQIELAAALRGEDGREIVKKVPFQIPASVAPGALNITFADGNWMNLLDQSAPAARQASSGAQLVRAINRLRRNNNLYVRVWRPDRGFELEGEQLPSPPASLKNLLGAAPSGGGGITNTWIATLAEMEMDGLETVVSGTETIRVTVKE
ncbi:MAG TPA: hypothetical protein VEU62_17245 [Bryobacterales bacterium]|nr:hypothetical protein [Bryobacterales bacterium]